MWTVLYRKPGTFGWEILDSYKTHAEATEMVKALLAQGYEVKVTHV